MCQLIVEAMEAGGCGWSSQILGDVGNVQRDFDGTPMVTDCMTDREVIAFSACAGDSRPRRRPRSPARSRPRRSSPARAAGRSSGTRSVVSGSREPARRDASTHTGRDEAPPRAQRGGGRPRLRPGHHRAVRSEIYLEEYNLWTSSRPGRKRARNGRGEDAKFADPERRRGPEGRDPRRTVAGSASPGTRSTEMKVNWISSDAPNAAELKERYEGWTIGEIAARGGQGARSTPCSTSRCRADLKAGFGTTMVETDPEAMKEVANVDRWRCPV